MSFDLHAVTEGVSGALDTKLPLIPAGEYPAQVTKIEGRNLETKNGTRTVVDITWGIDDAGVKAETNLDNPTCRQTLWLDLTDSGKLDTGQAKNVGLGRLREALGMNDGEFNFDMLLGQMAMVSVIHNPSKDDPETIYANINKVGAIG